MHRSKTLGGHNATDLSGASPDGHRAGIGLGIFDDSCGHRGRSWLRLVADSLRQVQDELFLMLEVRPAEPRWQVRRHGRVRPDSSRVAGRR
jgi:hypothetical protein